MNFVHPTHLVLLAASTIQFAEKAVPVLVDTSVIHKSSSNLSTNAI